MKKEKIMRFNYVVNQEKGYVVAYTKARGKTFRGIAKCSDEDVFDSEYGKRLAAAKCKYKIMKKEADEWADVVDFYRFSEEEFKKLRYEAEERAWNEYNRVDEAKKELDSILNECAE